MTWIIVTVVVLAFAAALRWGADSRDSAGWTMPARVGGPLSLRLRPVGLSREQCAEGAPVGLADGEDR
jgi:hypothetical protein